eukprot:COSAG02_NODE_32228_length_519_cov_6.121359_2_plen_66_part_00
MQHLPTPLRVCDLALKDSRRATPRARMPGKRDSDTRHKALCLVPQQATSGLPGGVYKMNTTHVLR